MTSGLPFDQIPGYCDLVKLTHKIYLTASASGMGKGWRPERMFSLGWKSHVSHGERQRKGRGHSWAFATFSLSLRRVILPNYDLNKTLMKFGN